VERTTAPQSKINLKVGNWAKAVAGVEMPGVVLLHRTGRFPLEQCQPGCALPPHPHSPKDGADVGHP
jgi:hypothetical protein